MVKTAIKRILRCTTLNNKFLELNSVPIQRGAYCESTRKKPLRGNKREQRHKAPNMVTHVLKKGLSSRYSIKSVDQWRRLNSIQTVTADLCLQQFGHEGQPLHQHLLQPTTTRNFSKPGPSKGDEKCPTKN